MKPDPAPSVPDKKVKELVSTVKSAVGCAVRCRGFHQLLERVVLAVNEMTVHVSLLAKELVLTKLDASEELSILDQRFYSALYTSLRSGKWKHGHEHILARRRIPDPGLGPVMSQAMSLAAKKLAAEVETHLCMHYERFYHRWHKCTERKKDDHNNPNCLDPDTVSTTELLRGAWCMRRDLKTLPNSPCGFALMPEASLTRT